MFALSYLLVALVIRTVSATNGDDICPSFTAAVTACAASSSVNAYCASYLGITTRTRTTTPIVATSTVTLSLPSLTTTSLFITPPSIHKNLLTTTTVRSYLTQPTKTLTNFITQTAYLNDLGSTLAIMRKRDMPTDVPTKLARVAKRGVPAPNLLATLGRADRSSACSCMHVPTPTIVRTINATATTTLTKYYPRTIRGTSTLPAGVIIDTLLSTQTIDVLAAAPLATLINQVLILANQCPPSMPAIFQCPEGTGINESTDLSFLMCPVDTIDSFQGDCIYWTDDGSPAGSLLLQGDGSGDPNFDVYRNATYGVTAADDCPAYADYLCNNTNSTTPVIPVGRMKRSSAQSPPKTPKEIAAHKAGTKHKIPYPPPARGGHMMGFVDTSDLKTKPAGHVIMTVNHASSSTAKATSPKTTHK